MNRPIAVLLATTATAILSLPALTAATPKIGGHENGWNLCEEQALHLYAEGAKAGLDLGRNRIDDGKLLASGKVVPEPRPCQWRDQLDVILHPPAPEPAVTDVGSTSTPQAPVQTSYAPAPTTSGGCSGTTPYSGGGQCWAIPYDIVLCESGGSYSAYNPSGASGAYQLMEGGTGSPAEQDANAAALWAGGAGRSNWVC